MESLNLETLLEMQRKLQDKYASVWEPTSVDTGKNNLLWMVGEIAEVADIIKKNGDHPAVEEPALREHLLEEMSDVLMYYFKVMLCYDISAGELQEAYLAKYKRNWTRWEAQLKEASHESADD